MVTFDHMINTTHQVFTCISSLPMNSYLHEVLIQYQSSAFPGLGLVILITINIYLSHSNRVMVDLCLDPCLKLSLFWWFSPKLESTFPLLCVYAFCCLQFILKAINEYTSVYLACFCILLTIPLLMNYGGLSYMY